MYDKNTQECCENRVIDNISQGCCGGQIFDTEVYECCGDIGLVYGVG